MRKSCISALLLGVLLPLHALIIYRPENHGEMNQIPCYLRIEDESGNDVTATLPASYEWVYQHPRRRAYTGAYYVSGGMAAHVRFAPGTYRISVYTPVKWQNHAIPQNEAEWTSNTFIYSTEMPLKVIFISPTGDDNHFYSGGWHIDWKAPPFVNSTKVHVQE